MQLGSHMVKTWSSTQSMIALSSGEAEYYGLVKAAAQCLSIKAVLIDFALDNNAAISIRAAS